MDEEQLKREDVVVASIADTYYLPSIVNRVLSFPLDTVMKTVIAGRIATTSARRF